VLDDYVLRKKEGIRKTEPVYSLEWSEAE